MKTKPTLETTFLADSLYGKSVVVGFSGGADSTALLHRLFSLREELSLSIKAVHIHHGIRGGEADRDLRLAENFCKELDIPFVSYRLDIPALAKERGLSLEECGRIERYRIFKEEAGEGLILTAHTASDSAETVLLNLLRGTGLRGLTGIPHIRGNIVRPLIHCTREQVEDYCHRMGLPFAEDSTNFSDDYTRSFLRQSIFPKLKEKNPAAVETILHTAALLSEDEDYLSLEAEKLFKAAKGERGLSVTALSSAHPAILGRAALLFFREENLPQNRNSIERFCRLIKKGSGKEELTTGVFLRIYRGELCLERQQDVPHFEAEISLLEGESTVISLPEGYYGGKNLCFSVKDRKNPEKVYKKLFFFSIDYDTIVGRLILRQKRPGDKLSLPHGEGHKTLKKLFSENGLSLEARASALVLADEKGIVWVEGFGADARCKITEQTKRVLVCIEVKKDCEELS